MAGSRARKKQPERESALQTREKLLTAGRSVFAAKGLGGASLRADILAKAGVSTGSFYHQFDDKADLLAEILRRDGEDVLRTMEKGQEIAGELDPMESSLRFLRRLFVMAEQKPEFVKIYVREYYSDDRRVRAEIRHHNRRTIANVRHFYEVLREKSGLPIDPDLIATLFATLCFGIINHYLDFPKSERPALRERYIAGMVQLGAGGVFAVRSLEDAAG